MNIWHKIKSWFSKKPEQLWYKKVVAIRGEDPIGVLIVDLATYDEKDEIVPAAGQRVAIAIPNSFRPTANRILSGTESQDDRDALELLVQSSI
jgi:hypothetical protein